MLGNRLVVGARRVVILLFVSVWAKNGDLELLRLWALGVMNKCSIFAFECVLLHVRK